jgi:tetratricopeptide (TPR) repeat protein
MFDWLHTAVHGAIDLCVHRAKDAEPPNLGWIGSIAAGADAFRRGKYEVAERFYLEAIRLACRSDFLDRLFQGSRVNAEALDQGLYHLGRLYDHQQRFAEAEDVWDRLLKVREVRCGRSHPLTANCYANLASACQEQGKLVQAEQHIKQALAVHARASSPHGEYLGFAYQVLGSICVAQEDWEGARSALERCLALREETLLPAHPDVVRTRERYAAVLDRLGRAEEAAQLRADLDQLQHEHEHLRPVDGPRRHVLQAGTPVLAALVAAHPNLYQPGDDDGPGLVLFSFASSIDQPEEYLLQLRDRLVQFVEQAEPTDDERRVADWLRDPGFVPDRRRQIPFALTQDRWVYLADVWVRRSALPNGYLAERLLRCTAEQSDGGSIEMLPG